MAIRQVRITTQNLDYPQDNDCLLASDDPIHAIKKSVMLGGLGMDATMQQYNSITHAQNQNPTVEQTLAEIKRTEIRKFLNRKGEDMAMPSTN